MRAIVGLISLTVEDWYEAVDFYHELLGLPLLESDEQTGRARLQAAPGLLLELLSGGWGSETPKTPRENPVALCLRVPALARTLQELEYRGVWLLGEPSNGLAPVADPEGNRVYLYDAPTPPSPADGWSLAEVQSED
ncbi:MAG: hypothetical protein M3P51_09190 [Chloroflexota bacterium]|nr:hypothetical protein [Chloroflexota bacterium]